MNRSKEYCESIENYCTVCTQTAWVIMKIISVNNNYSKKLNSALLYKNNNNIMKISHIMKKKS